MNDTTDFPSAFPTNPFARSVKKNNEGVQSPLYSDDELMGVLSLHEELSQMGGARNGDDDGDIDDGDEDDGIPSFHNLVTKTLQQIDDEGNDLKKKMDKPSFSIPTATATATAPAPIDEGLKQKIPSIRAIASDVDGTIISTKQTVHPRTRLAICNAIQKMKHDNENDNDKPFIFFPATGKSRKGCLDSIGIELGSLIASSNCPGVYLQGLFCVDQQNNVVFERKLSLDAIHAAELLVAETDISIVGYDGDDLYTTEQTNVVRHLHEHYGEPLPVVLPPSDHESHSDTSTSDSGVVGRPLSSHEPSMHKLLLMDNDVNKITNIVRPQLQAVADQYDADVTQAQATMLELLPRGCSKAVGVQKVCHALDIDMGTELLALGDAENDAGMLDLAAIGVAVANASPPALDAADYVMEYSNNDGGAGYAIEMFALSKN